MLAFLLSHGLPVERFGLVLAAGIVVHIASGPAIGQHGSRCRDGLSRPAVRRPFGRGLSADDVGEGC